MQSPLHYSSATLPATLRDWPRKVEQETVSPVLAVNGLAVATEHTGLQTAHEVSQANVILQRLFQDCPIAFAVRLWNGHTLCIGQAQPTVTLCLMHASVLRDMTWFADPQRLAEAYVDGNIQLEGDCLAVMQLVEYLATVALPWYEKMALLFRAFTLVSPLQPTALVPLSASTNSPLEELSNPEPRQIDQPDVASDTFYQCWLDDHMLHSCAYFTGQTQDLTQAQQQQLDLICLKLRLQHGDRLLDIGCGWGGLACWAAKHYGVFVHGITQHPGQYAYALKHIQTQGLQHLVTLSLVDACALPELGTYDKICQISVSEQPDASALADFLEKVHGLLKPGGLFLHHGISIERPQPPHMTIHAARPDAQHPQGDLPSLAQRLLHMEQARFEVFNIEGLRRHYVMTLRQWLTRLDARHADVAAQLGERDYRRWRLYLAASIVQFEQGRAGIHQILATRR